MLLAPPIDLPQNLDPQDMILLFAKAGYAQLGLHNYMYAVCIKTPTDYE